MRIWVPMTFWDDHAERSPADDVELDMAREVRRAGRKVLIEGTERQIENLWSDAVFYIDEFGPDETPSCIKRSAAATVAAIIKQVGPGK